MDGQVLFNIIATLFGILIGWILRVIWSEIKLVQSNQREFEKEINEGYVRKDDYRVDIAEIKGMLGRILEIRSHLTVSYSRMGLNTRHFGTF
jgi:hypothetical protein